MMFLKSHVVNESGRNPIVVPISYEGSDEEEVKMVPKNSNVNKSYNIVYDSRCDGKEKRIGENLFWAKNWCWTWSDP